MKAFRFSLERALHLRRMQLEMEQARLLQINGELLQTGNSVTALQSFNTETRTWLSGSASLESGSVATVPQFQQRTRQHILTMQGKKAELKSQTEAQKTRTLEAQRKVKLLETLRKDRHARWVEEADKEQENFAADAFLARWTSAH